jgi:hypothetical protein
MQLLARHSGLFAVDIQRTCSSRRVKPCLRLNRQAPLFNLRHAVHRMERALRLMVDAHVQQPGGMHVLVADAGGSQHELV